MEEHHLCLANIPPWDTHEMMSTCKEFWHHITVHPVESGWMKHQENTHTNKTIISSFLWCRVHSFVSKLSAVLHDVRVHPKMFTMFPVHFVGWKVANSPIPSRVGLLRWQKTPGLVNKDSKPWQLWRLWHPFLLLFFNRPWTLTNGLCWLMYAMFFFGFYGPWFQKMWCTLLGTNIYPKKRFECPLQINSCCDSQFVTNIVVRTLGHFTLLSQRTADCLAQLILVLFPDVCSKNGITSCPQQK